MKALISEINERLKDILLYIESDKNEVELQLNDVQEKIDTKIDEAKNYKTDIDHAKERIRVFEVEIEGYEDDLRDLTERFSNKDLNAILETGNKEINLKIANCQKDIAKQRDKINELTERARMIKDLLINLKKDKETKKGKLDNLTNALNYYQAEFNRIIEFSEENPDSLVVTEEVVVNNEEPLEYVVDYSYLRNEPIVDDKPIFDVIENIEKENDEDMALDMEESNGAEKEENVALDVVPNQEDDTDEEVTSGGSFLLDDFGDFSAFNLDDVQEEEQDEKTEEDKNEINEDNGLLEDDAEEQKDIVSLFEHDKTQRLDFKTLNDSIDKEYENIFGENIEDIDLNDNPFNVTADADNIFEGQSSFGDFSDAFMLTEKDILGDDFEEESAEVIESSEPANDKAAEFFKANNLDITNFNKDDQEYLNQKFDLVSYTKTLDILRKNNIKMENLYNAANIFDVNHLELESIINKLLLAGQTTQNISYVLNALPLINSLDLNNVIESYGPSVKDANITDLIIKAKHLKDIGGGAR